jgi:hypothetical protein
MPEPVWYQNKGTKSGTGLRCWNVDADEFGLDADAQLWFSNFFAQPAFEDPYNERQALPRKSSS